MPLAFLWAWLWAFWPPSSWGTLAPLPLSWWSFQWCLKQALSPSRLVWSLPWTSVQKKRGNLWARLCKWLCSTAAWQSGNRFARCLWQALKHTWIWQQRFLVFSSWPVLRKPSVELGLCSWMIDPMDMMSQRVSLKATTTLTERSGHKTYRFNKHFDFFRFIDTCVLQKQRGGFVFSCTPQHPSTVPAKLGCPLETQSLLHSPPSNKPWTRETLKHPVSNPRQKP